jgi:polygalacturonase
MKIFDVTNYGAVGDGLKDNSIAIQNAIDDCSKCGGGTVYFPGNNIFMSGPFDLKTNVNLMVEAGSCILANPDESVYKKSAFRENLGEGTIWIGGENAENISITGRGVIDGNGMAFMGPEEKAAYVLKPFKIVDPRPHLLTLVNVKKLLIRDITVKNSAYWCLHIIGCDDVKIESVTILNSLKIRNGDGIDIDHSRNVRISNCYIESGDDCVCLKTRREYEDCGPTENVIVSNCIMTSTSCSIKLGSENMDAIRNVIVSDCIINSSNRGIGIQNRDEGVVENIIFKNIFVEGRLFDDVWWGKAEPIYVTAYKRKASADKDSNIRFAKGQTVGKVGKVSRIFFDNIKCNSENGVFIGGEEGKVSDIKIENSSFRIERKTNYEGGIYDLRPSDTIGLLKDDISAFYLDTAKDIVVSNCSVEWGKENPGYFNKVLFAKNIENLSVTKISGEAAKPNSEKCEFLNCQNITVE